MKKYNEWVQDIFTTGKVFVPLVGDEGQVVESLNDLIKVMPLFHECSVAQAAREAPGEAPVYAPRWGIPVEAPLESPQEVALTNQLAQAGLKLKKMDANGNCLFTSICHQLR